MKRTLSKKSIFFLSVFIFFMFLVSIYIKCINLNKIKTELVLNGTLENCIDTPCFVVRDETLVEAPSGKILNFMLEDGEKLECGRVIAQIYETEKDEIIINKIKKIDDDINILENLKNIYGKTFGKKEHISKAISEILSETKLNFFNNEYLSLKGHHKKVLDILSINNALVNENEDLSQKINKLKEEKESLEKSLQSSNIQKVLSSSSGYITFSSDGFENILPLERLKNLNPKSVSEILNSAPAKINSKAKIVRSSNWYIVCNVPLEKLEKIEIGSDVEISSFGTFSEKIPAKVIYINKSSNEDNVASLVLKCDYINKETLNFRKGNIHIIFNEFNGLKFSKNALREQFIQKTEKDSDGKEFTKAKPIFGVYILDSKDKNKKVFKEVEILFSNNDFVICKNKGERKNGTGNHLCQYDEILV